MAQLTKDDGPVSRTLAVAASPKHTGTRRRRRTDTADDAFRLKYLFGKNSAAICRRSSAQTGEV
jgi:hypothetical protein